MEFQLANFKGKVDEVIGKQISYLKVLGENKEACFIPIIFWLKTADNKCHRFFIDAWMLHWAEYSITEMEELIDEDLEEHDSFVVHDLMSSFDLKDKMIDNVEMNYIKLSEQLVGKLLIEIANKGTIEILDYGDKKEQELKIKIG
ncbi:hypothetical protein C8N46_107109 [Kordia periserrulae]|uniref:Uncharacterized protein n=1 Tax=Kordia periserrulae TaxID=701523 RepID=A0A2T6BVL6_9FLAO|nr:hypothetical protein [Kordia periserrulae]PTX60103.1 hypothetical protein C8N46_107109 [Kordia periserrulae]